MNFPRRTFITRQRSGGRGAAPTCGCAGPKIAFGAQPPVDLILIGMMVIARLLGCLLPAAMPDDELTKMAADLYLHPASSRKGIGYQKRHPR